MMSTPPKPPPQPLQAHLNPWGEHHPRDTQLQGPKSIPHQGVPPPSSIISRTPPGAASTRHAATPLACLLPSAAVVKKLNFHLFSHPCLSRCRRFPRSVAPGSPRSRLRMIQWVLGDAEFIFPLLFSTCFSNPSREVGASGVTPPAFVPPLSHGQRWGGFGKKREKTVTGVQTTPCVPRVQDPADSHPGVPPGSPCSALAAGRCVPSSPGVTGQRGPRGCGWCDDDGRDVQVFVIGCCRGPVTAIPAAHTRLQACGNLGDTKT